MKIKERLVLGWQSHGQEAARESLQFQHAVGGCVCVCVWGGGYGPAAQACVIL